MTRAMAIPLFTLIVASCALAADPATRPTDRQGAPSKIVAVTVYETNALVAREVTVPNGIGQFELIVGPLPPSTINSSLYSEGTDGIRVLTTRFRTWVMQENVQEVVRQLDSQLKAIEKDNQSVQRQIQTTEQNLQLLTKMEEFTSGALKQMTEKGLLNADAPTKLAEFIMTQRQTRSADLTTLQQKLAANQEQSAYLQRERSKVSAGSDRTIREAVIVVDKPNEGPGAVKLNYLVAAASWRPQYRLRASAAKDNPEVQLEYLAAINQQSGEDWTGVDLVLSTAQPLLNAAPPELAMLEVAISPRGASPGSPAKPGNVTVNGGNLNPNSGDNRKQQRQFEQQGQMKMNQSATLEGNKFYNDAAALQQADEIILGEQLRLTSKGGMPVFREGQSVTFHIERKMSVPWRDDEQVIEVARSPLKPDWFYKAVPVLTPHVYRLANLVNDSKYVILPGEATMYLGADFVGRARLGLVAIGEQFTAGFGVDPQVQVQRVLVDKTRTTQGGNQVLKFDYRIAISSYKSEPVNLQLWDRLPHAENEQVNVTLLETKPELSKDARYLRDDRPSNLLLWELSVAPGVKAEKAMMINYQYKLEFEKSANIQRFESNMDVLMSH